MDPEVVGQYQGHVERDVERCYSHVPSFPAHAWLGGIPTALTIVHIDSRRLKRHFGTIVSM